MITPVIRRARWVSACGVAFEDFTARIAPANTCKASSTLMPNHISKYRVCPVRVRKLYRPETTNPAMAA